MMLMVGVTFRNQDAKASYRRFREKGRMMPVPGPRPACSAPCNGRLLPPAVGLLGHDAPEARWPQPFRSSSEQRAGTA